MHEINFYRTKQGKCQVEEFLDNLSGKIAQKITWVLKIIEEGNVIPISYFKKLENTDEIWEVRTRIGSNSYRILCFYGEGKNLILSNGFLKKSQKTPKSEIKIAERNRKDYFNR